MERLCGNVLACLSKMGLFVCGLDVKLIVFGELRGFAKGCDGLKMEIQGDMLGLTSLKT